MLTLNHVISAFPLHEWSPPSFAGISLAEAFWARSLALAFRIKKNAQNAHRGRNKPGIMLLIGGSRPFGDAMVWCACRSNYLGQMMSPTRRECSSPRASSNPVAWAPFLPVRNPAPSLNFGLAETAWAVGGDTLSGKKLERHSSEPASSLECILTKNATVNPLECVLTKSLDLKSFGMCTYKKKGWEGVGVSAARTRRTSRRIPALRGPPPR